MDLPDPSVTPTLSVIDAGRIVGLSKDGAYKAAKSGELPVLHFGGKMRVPTALLLEMLGLRAATP